MIDTTILIDALRGVRWIGELLRALPAVPLASAVSVAEVYRGMRESEAAATADLFGWVEIVPAGAEEGRIAGLWQRDYAARGMTLDVGDALIAATALTQRAVLATGSVRDFPMPEVRVEHWPSGGGQAGPAAG